MASEPRISPIQSRKFLHRRDLQNEQALTTI